MEVAGIFGCGELELDRPLVIIKCTSGETEAQGGWRFAQEPIKAGWGQSGELSPGLLIPRATFLSDGLIRKKPSSIC